MNIHHLILTRLSSIRNIESEFLTIYWKDIYVSYESDSALITKHISEVNFSELNSSDLVRIFEYVILIRDSISRVRVQGIIEGMF